MEPPFEPDAIDAGWTTGLLGAISFPKLADSLLGASMAGLSPKVAGSLSGITSFETPRIMDSVSDFISSSVATSTKDWLGADRQPAYSTATRAERIEQVEDRLPLISRIVWSARDFRNVDLADLAWWGTATGAVLLAWVWMKLGAEDGSPEQKIEGAYWLLAVLLAAQVRRQ
jgi:hypothetical protein